MSKELLHARITEVSSLLQNVLSDAKSLEEIDAIGRIAEIFTPRGIVRDARDSFRVKRNKLKLYVDTERWKKVSSKMKGDRGYCTVVSLALTTTGITLAKKIASRSGRKKGHGFYPSDYAYQLSLHGYRMTKVPIAYDTTIGDVFRDYRDGKYMVSLNGHCFAMIDGDIIDHTNRKASTRVHTLHKIEKR